MERLTIDSLPDGSDALAGAFLCGEYHGGMMSAMYAVASTGSLELRKGEGLGRLIKELREAVGIAESDYPEDADDLSAFLRWCEKKNDEIEEEVTA